MKAGASPVQLEPRNTAGACSVNPTEAPGGVSIHVWNKPTCSICGGRNPPVSFTAVSPAPSLYLAHVKTLGYKHLLPERTCHLQLDFGATHQLPGGPSYPALPPNLPSAAAPASPATCPPGAWLPRAIPRLSPVWPYSTSSLLSTHCQFPSPTRSAI